MKFFTNAQWQAHCDMLASVGAEADYWQGAQMLEAERHRETKDELRRTKDQLDAVQRGHLLGFAYASDDAITAQAAMQPAAKDARIVDLTQRLAREQAKVYELGDANAKLNQSLKEERRAQAGKPMRVPPPTLDEFDELAVPSIAGGIDGQA